jgi:hypothetical protein
MSTTEKKHRRWSIMSRLRNWFFHCLQIAFSQRIDDIVNDVIPFDRRSRHRLVQDAVDKRVKEILAEAERVGVSAIHPSDINRTAYDAVRKTVQSIVEDKINDLVQRAMNLQPEEEWE